MEFNNRSNRQVSFDPCIPDFNHRGSLKGRVNTLRKDASSTLQCRRSKDRRCSGRKLAEETPKKTRDGNFVPLSRGNSTDIEEATSMRARNKYAGEITGLPGQRYVTDHFREPNQPRACHIETINDSNAISLLETKKRVSGTKLFWYSNQIWEPFRCTKVKNKRVIPKFPCVVVECGSLLGAPQQYRALMCMARLGFVWRLCCIHRLTDQCLTVSTFRPGNLMTQPIPLAGLLFDSLIFVNVHSQTCKLFSNPAILNKTDKALDSQPLPSVFVGVFETTVASPDVGTEDNLKSKQRKLKRERQKLKKMFTATKNIRIDLRLRKKSRRNRKRGRGGKRYKKIENLPKVYTTLFLPSNLSLPYDPSVKQERNTLIVPELEKKKIKESCGIRLYRRFYHVVSSKSFRNLNGIPLEESTVFLNLNSIRKFPMVDIETDNPLRLFLCETSDILDLCKIEFEEPMQMIDDVFEFPMYIVNSNKSNCQLPGVCVSMWDQSSSLPEFSIEECRNLQKCFGIGFGSRRCCWSSGMNLYLGARRNRLANDAPNLSGPIVSEVEYCKSFFDNWALQAPLRKKICASVDAVINKVRKINPNFFNFIGYGSCSRFMWTQGTLKVKTKQEGNNLSPVRTIGFANGLHFDLGDRIDHATAEGWLSKIPTNKMKDWIHKVGKRVGFGLPTSCGYNHVGVQGDRTLNAKFIIGPFTMDLKHRTFHHFLGYSIPHCTVAPVLYDQKIILNNETESDEFLIIAWGGSGSSKNAVDNRKIADGTPGVSSKS